jgi:toxin ParE1/3/4
MTYTVILSPAADDDLIEIADFIAKDKPERAISFVMELEDRARNFLGAAPSAGTMYKDGLRFTVLSGYVVLYEIDDARNNVYVHHIFQGSRNWRK